MKYCQFLIVFGTVVAANANAATISALTDITDVSVSQTGSATFFFTSATALSDDVDVFRASSLVNDTSTFFVDDSFAGPTNGFAQSSWSLGAQSVSARATSAFLSSSFSELTAAGNALASTLSEIAFTVSGVGSVTIDMDVAFSTSLFDASGFSEFADMSASLGNNLGVIDTDGFFVDGSFGDGTYDEVTTLSITIDVDGVGEGILVMETFGWVESGVAPVPLPAAVWLFGTALLGFIKMSKRKTVSV